VSDLNKWLGSGRLTRDAELTFTKNGTALCKFGLCSNRVYTNSGQKVEEATFVDVTLWGKQAEFLSEYLTKGNYIIVEGRLNLNVWEKDGAKRQKLEVIADQINLVPRGGGNGGGSGVKSSRNENVESSQIDDEVPF